ncbi:MAG: phosphatidylglycerophosphatase A [Gemmataceae bacterium]
MTRAIASLGGVGDLRPAPGTWGAAVALIPATLLLLLAGPIAVAAGALMLAGLGWWAASVELATTDEDDPEWVVIDEAAGQWLALAGLPAFGWLGLALAFALFRLFDILKPGPVGWADRRPGATGVMLDDLVAGLLAALCLWGLSPLLPPEVFP